MYIQARKSTLIDYNTRSSNESSNECLSLEDDSYMDTLYIKSTEDAHNKS